MDAVVLLAGGAGFVALGKSIAFLVSGAALPLLTKVIGKLRVAIKLLRYEMMLNPLFAAGVGVAAIGLKIHKDSVAIEEFTKDLKDGVIALKDAEKTLKQMDTVLEEGIGNFDPQIVEWEKIFGPIGSEEELQKIRDRISKIVKDLQDLEDGKKKIFDPQKGTGGGDSKSPFATFTDELNDFDNALEQVTVNGFKKLEDSILQFVQTGKLAVKDLVRSILADFAKLMIRETVTKPLFSIFRTAITSGLSGLGGGPAPMPEGFMGTGIPEVLPPGSFNITGSAKGNTFARNGIVPYSKGGLIRRPTLSLMGEQGAEAILPLQRGRGGRLGVAMQGGGGGGVTTVNYTGPTLNFNGDEYVPRSAVGGFINAAASKGDSMGETRAMRSLQNSRSARGRLGM